MDALVSLRRNMKEMRQRESNACEQVKRALQMAEEANLEKTKVNLLRNKSFSVFRSTANISLFLC